MKPIGYGLKKGSESETVNKVSQIDLSQFKKIAAWVPVVAVLSALVYFVIINFSQEEEKPPVKEISIEEAKETIDTVVAPVLVADSIIVPDSIELRIDVLRTEFFYIKIDSLVEISKTGRSGNSYIYKALNNFNVYVADGSNTRIFLNDSLVQDVTQKDYRINYLYLTSEGVLDKSITKLKLEETNNEEITPLNIYIDSASSQ